MSAVKTLPKRVGAILSDSINKHFVSFCVVFRASVQELNWHTVYNYKSSSFSVHRPLHKTMSTIFFALQREKAANTDILQCKYYDIRWTGQVDEIYFTKKTTFGNKFF
jgi:hypothetical protein